MGQDRHDATPGQDQTATLLANGQVLVLGANRTGGLCASNFSNTASAELYTP